MHALLRWLLVLVLSCIILLFVFIVYTLIWSDPVAYDNNVRVIAATWIPQPNPEQRCKFAVQADSTSPMAFTCGEANYFANRPLNYILVQNSTIIHCPRYTEHPADARMFRNESGELRLLFVDGGQMTMSRLDGADRQYLTYAGAQQVEKNWTPYVYNQRLFFVTRLLPLHVVEWAPNGQCRVIKNNGNWLEWNRTHLRGGSPMCHWQGTYYIGIAHTAGHSNQDWKRTSSYRPIIYVFDAKTMRICNVSRPIDTTQLTAELTGRMGRYVRVQFGVALWREHGKWYAIIDYADNFSCRVELNLETWLQEVVDLHASVDSTPDHVAIQANNDIAQWVNHKSGGLGYIASWWSTLHIRRRSCKWNGTIFTSPSSSSPSDVSVSASSSSYSTSSPSSLSSKYSPSSSSSQYSSCIANSLLSRDVQGE